MSALPFPDALRRLLGREDLTRAETEELFGQLMDGALDAAQKAALLIGLAMKGETASEIAGAAAAMRRRVVPIPHSRPLAVDTCGTGGDGRGTFNISTAAALVAAAGGAAIAKHGNRSVSSRSGSADVLAALGVPIEVEPEVAGRALDEIGIAFLFAPRLHPAMREVMPVRRALAVRTVFNLLGPLTNPAGAQAQVLGVYARDKVELLARVLLELGVRHALVVHGSDGLDEITTTGPTFVAEVPRWRAAHLCRRARGARPPPRRPRRARRRRAGGERGPHGDAARPVAPTPTKRSPRWWRPTPARRSTSAAAPPRCAKASSRRARSWQPEPRPVSSPS